MRKTETQKQYQKSTAEFMAYIRYLKEGLIELREYLKQQEAE